MTATYDPIQASFESAARDFKASLSDKELVDQILTVKTVDDVYDFTDKLQKQQAGRLRNLSKIQPYLETLRSYASVIEVFIQTKQDVLCLIWGPIKFLLQWADNMRKSFDAVVDTLAEISLLLPEFHTASQLFQSNELLKDVLVLFFRDILDVYLITLKFFRKTRWRIIFDALWTKQQGEINVVKTQIERHTRLLRREVKMEHIQEAHDTYLQAREHHERTEKTLRRQEYWSIRTAVSPPTYEKDLDRLLGLTCEGTGQWLLADAAFVKWLDKADTTTRVLWLQGIPGAGKTFLASTIVQESKKIQETRTIYAFLSYTHRATLSALSILHSLIFQLSAGQDDLEEVVRQSNHEELKGSVSAANDLLQKLLGYAGPTYIVLDGLDEIHEQERYRLLKELLKILEACQEARVIISSRGEADIAQILKSTKCIRVDRENTESIQQFVSQRCQEWFSKCNFLPEARVEIELLLAPLAVKAQGMFLYADVVFRSLDFLDDMEQIKEELTVLPENLHEAYARIWRRVNHLPPKPKEKVRRILGWVGCTPAPLTIAEIEQALVVGPTGVDGDGKVIASLNLPRICGPIVEEVDEYVQFVHFTVKEYLFSPKIDGFIVLADATFDLAACCVKYLCQQHHRADLTDQQIADNTLSGSYRLQNFAAAMWPELVVCSLELNKKELPDNLNHALEVLVGERSSETYRSDGEEHEQPSLKNLEPRSPLLYNTLCKVVHFRKLCETQDFDMNHSPNWTNHDPLTISVLSVRVHKQMRNLGSCRDNQHQNCHCKALHKHYGLRPFKCGLLNCPSYRRGFESLSSQKTHMKQHDRPWKCSDQGCEFATGGFLSRKMRDAHLDRYHKVGKSKEQPAFVDTDAEELEALLSDLITADNVDGVRSLKTKVETLPSRVQEDLYRHAASVGSCTMVDLLLQWESINYQFLANMLICSIEAMNVDTFGETLSFCLSQSQKGHLYYRWGEVFSMVIKSESEELYNEWETQLHSVYLQDPALEELYNWSQEGVIKATAGIPHREGMLLAFWKKLGPFKAKGGNRELSKIALRDIAATSCSVNLASYFIDNGCDADGRPSERALTPLHCAARNTTAAGAEMMKYLLLRGADPEDSRFVTKRKISEEKGAKNVSKWLGISWDELVAQTREQREKAGKAEA